MTDSKDEKETVEPKRVFGKNMILDSDLFKLKIANMKKNVGYSEKKQILIDVEHCHFYRTIDSSGREQANSSFVGGHTHDVKVSVSQQGELKASCGKARGSKFEDTHVHKIDYVRSDKIHRRRMNEEAQISINNRSNI